MKSVTTIITMGFKQWIAQVSRILYKTYRVTICDVPDEDYYFNYDNGMNAHDMVQIVVDRNDLV